MPEPRLVGMPAGTSTGLFRTFAYMRLQNIVLLRDAAGVNHAVDGYAVLGHALQNDARVQCVDHHAEFRKLLNRPAVKKNYDEFRR